MNPKKGLLKISRLAEKAGVTVPTVKHYLREGLLPRPVKTSRNMAYYSETCVDRIRSVKKIQKEKFLPLDVIKRLIDSGEPFEEELALGKAILKTDRVVTGKAPVPRYRIEKTTGCPLNKIDLLEEKSLIHPQASGDSKVYHPEDVELIHIMKIREDMGVPTDTSLSTLSIYRDAMTHAVAEDINFFVRNIMGDTPTRQAIRFLTEADETLDRFIISYRQKMLRQFGEKTIRSLNRLPQNLAVLNILPVAGSELPDRPPEKPVENMVYHLLKGNGRQLSVNNEPEDLTQKRHELRALAVLNVLLHGGPDKALGMVKKTIPKPSFHALENMAAALVYLFSMDSSSGLAAPMFGIKKVFAYLKRLEHLHGENTPAEIFPRYVCGAVYIFLPGVFNTRHKGIEILAQLKKRLAHPCIDSAELPQWLKRTLQFELLPVLDVRLNRFLAQGYLKTGEDKLALACLEAVIDTADSDSEHAVWAKLERVRIT